MYYMNHPDQFILFQEFFLMITNNRLSVISCELIPIHSITFCSMVLKNFYLLMVGDVIKTLKENNNVYTWGNVTVKLAEAYGFCWGVERAVQIAYEARKQFPEEKIWITNEIIHNPTVNKVSFFLILTLWSLNFMFWE
jgi:LytB protein